MSEVRQLTLSYLITEHTICLALKKRGSGEGNWNGYGGKLEEGEDVLKAAVREIEEESEVVVEKNDLEKIAIIEFIFETGEHLEVHTFFARKWEGEPKETEEMKPRWFQFKNIPYDLMWDDDQHWLSRAIVGEKLRGKVWFSCDGRRVKKMKWNQVDRFE